MKDKSIKNCILIMSLIGGIMALLVVISPININVKLIMGIILCIAFAITKHPAFGIAYTVLFFITRVSILLGGGTLLALAISWMLIIFFIAVNIQSIKLHRSVKFTK